MLRAVTDDIVIAGGGPAGTTVATLALKYNPDLKVLVLEKAKHPREHVGESLLPGVTGILAEMGVWDKMEAANFPIKIGASLTWGKQGDRSMQCRPGSVFEVQQSPSNRLPRLAQ